MYILYLAKLKERRRPFFEGTGKDGASKVRYPKLHLVFFYHIYFALPCLILLTLWSHEIFLKPSSWPKTMYAEQWRKLAWASPWEISLYFQYNNPLEHWQTVAHLSMLLCFQSKISFNRLFWLFLNLFTSSQ